MHVKMLESILNSFDWIRTHRRIVLRGRSQRFISIDVTLADKLSSLWVNSTKISHLDGENMRQRSGDDSAASPPIRFSVSQLTYLAEAAELILMRSTYLLQARFGLRNAITRGLREKQRKKPGHNCTLQVGPNLADKAR
jgi:hypothetical protein